MTSPDTKMTPMMTQWHECKNEAPEAILFFRLGDFYEAFYEDAELCSKVLDLTLTKRQQVPMSGIPAHAAEGYIEKLLAEGFKVAIAEQLEEPSAAKGLVKRAITRILTPAALSLVGTGGGKESHYFASISKKGGQWGLALFDLGCADCRVIEFSELTPALEELHRFKPRELLLSSKQFDQHRELFTGSQSLLGYRLETTEEWRFDPLFSGNFLKDLLKVHTLDGFGLKEQTASIAAAGALLAYIKDTLKLPLDALQTLRPYSNDDFLRLDPSTLRHLDLIGAARSKSPTLLGILDATLTPMGSRLIKKWLLQPLLSLKAIKERQDSIETLMKAPKMLEALRNSLTEIRDLERLITRIGSPQGNPKQIVSLAHSLKPVKGIKQLLAMFSDPLLVHLNTLLPEFSNVVEAIEQAVEEDPPLRVKEGGIFRQGFHPLLDELRNLSHSSKAWMEDYQHRIREELGIKTAKVGYSRVGGFYIEVSRGQAGKMPPHFHRRQTLTNAERYTSDELGEYEKKIFHADEKKAALEEELFIAFKAQIFNHCASILKAAEQLAILDVLGSLAEIAIQKSYIRPLVDDSDVIEIKGGRHPVIESAMANERFVANDTLLDNDTSLMLITGPNMAGKSTYIRQVALLVVMAQMGSFIPASAARIGKVDRLFTRIGASDDLSRGQSTFMVEMTETAHILHHVTPRSLVILDEIGRGTSTYDGISLAWSIAEYLLTQKDKKAKTLFATHYFELTKLEEKLAGAKNFTVAVHESAESLTFLRKIVRGTADKSYGIHVAKLAGIPPSVLERSEEILKHLEESGNQKNLFTPPPPVKRASKKAHQENQLLLFIE